MDESLLETDTVWELAEALLDVAIEQDVALIQEFSGNIRANTAVTRELGERVRKHLAAMKEGIVE